MNNQPIRVHQIVHSALAQGGAQAGMRRLVPVAWPILEVEHTIKVRIEEEIGVVERFLIEALARFGTMTAEQLAQFLGLETFVVEAVVDNLKRFPDTIISDNKGYTAPPDSIDRLNQGKWSRILETAESFYVDGMDGRLLPLSLSKAHRARWIHVDSSAGSCLITDHAKNPMKNICWISTTCPDGERSLKESITNSNLDSRLELGIPAGAFDIVSGKANIKNQRWILVLLEVMDDGSVKVRPASASKNHLAHYNAARRSAIEECLRRGNERAYGILNPDSDSAASNEVPSDWKSFIEYTARDGDFVITMKDTVPLRFWQIEDDAEDESTSDFKDIDPSKSTKLPGPLLTIMRSLYWWNPYLFTVRRVVPGDKSTSEVLLLLKGMNDLRRIAARAENEEIDLLAWWEEFQHETTESWPKDVMNVRVPFKTMIREASKSPDGQIVELVNEFL